MVNSLCNCGCCHGVKVLVGWLSLKALHSALNLEIYAHASLLWLSDCMFIKHFCLFSFSDVYLCLFIYLLIDIRIN